MDIEALKNGSQAAFRDLVEQYQSKVLRTCCSFVHSREDAEDLAQEVFVEVYRSAGSFRSDSQIGTWIYRISINKSLDYVRKQRRKKRIADLKGLFSAKNRSIETPHQQLEEKERAEILREQIAALPETQNIALTLSQHEKMSNRQIAEIMAVSESAVQGLLHRARANLRKNLENYFKKNL